MDSPLSFCGCVGGMTLKKTCISKVFRFYARLRHAKIRSLNHLLLPTLTPGGLKFAKTRKKGAAGLQDTSP